jgi:hypothetical protein
MFPVRAICIIDSLFLQTSDEGNLVHLLTHNISAIYDHYLRRRPYYCVAWSSCSICPTDPYLSELIVSA